MCKDVIIWQFVVAMCMTTLKGSFAIRGTKYINMILMFWRK